jgi:hypothetical protein
MTRFTLYLKDEQLEALAKRSAETGAPVSELIRRAIEAALVPAKAAKK